MNKILLGVLASTSLTFSATAQTKPYFQQKVDTKIEVKLDDTKHTLTGHISMEYYNNSPDTLTYIYIHLYPNAYSSEYSAYATQSVENKETEFYLNNGKDWGKIDSLDFIINQQPAKIAPTKEVDVVKLLLNQPLLPNQKITIETPFWVQLPKTFSRLGHIDQSYQISQWFPKPAVYDREGWHPIPYLNQGEFYSEYGDYEVKITVPKNYVVMASGNLLENEEKEWLRNRSTTPMTATKGKLPIIESDKEFKTLTYQESNIHDFAWFADKQWNVIMDTILLPNNQMVESYIAYDPRNEKAWSKSKDFVSQTIKGYSKYVGNYPYQTVKVIEGGLIAGGGMEYPTVTVIAPTEDVTTLQQVIIHEVGHNWFYGILGSNERIHPWMDEGINSYYERRVMNDNPLSETKGLMKFGTRLEHMLPVVMDAHHNINAINSRADSFDKTAYAYDLYGKSVYAFNALATYMGQEQFDAAMHVYFNEWQFKHPNPEDLMTILKSYCKKDLTWFENYLKEEIWTDFKLKKVNRTAGTATIKNKSPYEQPAFLKVGTEYMVTLPFRGTTTINIPNLNDSEKVSLANVLPDINTANNVKGAPFHLGLGFGLNDAPRRNMWWLPSIGYNKYDGFELGILLHNYSVPERKFQYMLSPLYGFNSKNWGGYGNITYAIYPHKKAIQRIDFNLNAKHFSNREYGYNLESPIFSTYTKFNPEMVLNFKPSSYRSSITDKLKIGAYVIFEDNVRYTNENVDSIYRPAFNGKATNVFGKLSYEHKNNRTFNPFSWKLDALSNDVFAKISGTAKFRIDYFHLNKGVDIRVFGGKLIQYKANTNLDQRYMLNANYNTTNDYLYEYNAIGRNEQDGLGAHQLFEEDGNMKMPLLYYANPFGVTDNWLAAININADLPMRLPIRVFLDIATYADAKHINPSGNNLLYMAGLQVKATKYLNINIPVFMSKDYKEYKTSILGENSFWKTVTFQFNFKDINWFRPQDNLLNSF